MKKLLVTVLVLAAAAFAQQPTQPQTAPPAGQPQQPGATGQAAAPAQQKQIKDPAEYNAYMSAVNQTDPAAKATALDSFLQQYPNSVMKTDALELLMASYQEARNPQKTTEAANRLLQADPTNLRALALLAYNERVAAQSGQNPQQNLTQAAQHAQAGLQALQSRPKPDGMSGADYDKFKHQLTGIFSGAMGINALQNKDYPTAQSDLRTAVEVTPNDFSLVYPLALAYLQAPQPDFINGIFFIARAVSLAPPQMQAQISQYGQGRYAKYHGGTDGWDQVLAAAKTAPLPPADFAIKPAPTPAEQAAALVQSKAVKDMSFGEFVSVFTSGNPQAAETVWSQIKDKPLAIEGSVISATATKLMIAATVDDITAKKPDIELTMAAPLTRLQVPKEGATIQFEGTPASYTAEPFLMQMDKGALLTKAAPKAAPKASPTRKRPTTRRPPPK